MGWGRVGRACLMPLPVAPPVQEVLVYGTALVSAGVALALGLRGEQRQCPTCAGLGGIRCIVCSGRGDTTPQGALTKEVCRACKGATIIKCRTCKGSGFDRGLR